MCQHIEVVYKKIIIFEHSQNTNIGNKTKDQVKFSLTTLCVFNKDPRKIIDNDGEEKDKDIYRNEKHVENTTG